MFLIFYLASCSFAVFLRGFFPPVFSVVFDVSLTRVLFLAALPVLYGDKRNEE